MFHRAPLLLLAALAAGCGQKGPLILPDAHTREPVMRPAPATTTSPAPPIAPDAATTAPAVPMDRPAGAAPAPSKDERKKPPQ
ncbi:MAG: lipoprotein [Steroidobacteraceae bacterium]